MPMRYYLVFLLAVFAWACAPKPVTVEPEPVADTAFYLPVEFKEVEGSLSSGLEGQGLESWTELKKPLERSLIYVRSRDARKEAVCVPELCLKWGDIQETLETLLALLPDIDRNPEILEHFFDFYAVSPDILLTGYYEPLLEASRYPHPEYPYPVYSVPDDLQTVDLGKFHPRWQGQKLVYRVEDGKIEPYHDRESIEQEGVLRGRNFEIAWVKDPVDLFFLHIQGSGRLKYADNDHEHVLYSGQNGLQYVALGRVLVDMGYMEPQEVSMQSIRDFLDKNKHLVDSLLAENPSYIFFSLDDQGPRGSTGQILTPYVSVASDPAYIPWGSAMILDAVLPEYQGQKTSVSGPVLSQDTGGAIRGRHLDLFCGFGDRAEYLAGKMKDRAKVYLMVIKNDQN
ncbi:MAG: murein transglycosylase A [Desulfonatronovibrio sp.]